MTGIEILCSNVLTTVNGRYHFILRKGEDRGLKLRVGSHRDQERLAVQLGW